VADGRERRSARDREDARQDARAPQATSIPVSPRAAVVLGALGFLALIGLLWAAPSVLYIALGGATLALTLSFPVRLLSRVMRRGLAVLVTVVVLLGLISLGFAFLVPLLVDQLGGLVSFLPEMAARAQGFFEDAVDYAEERWTLPMESEDIIDDAAQDLFDRARDLAEGALTGLVGFVSSAFNVGVLLFGIVVVAIYAVLDIRRIKAAYLRATPRAYRRDARELWRSFDASLSRYLGGLVVVLVVQGALSGLALWLIGVPYPVALGAWVSLTAVIPYLGAWLGAIPALLLAAFVSPSALVLTALAFVGIQQLESHVLTPRIQGQAVRMHPIVVILTVVGGAELAGLAGAIFAVPALAVLRVATDFLRARLYVRR
jgi:predicted PurR-regulated permease PerM